MNPGSRLFIVLAFTFVAFAGPAAGLAAAQQQIKIEGLFPRQLPLGQATTISVAVPSRDAIKAAEISPPQGVTVSGIRLGQAIQGALTWSELTIDVAKDAAPGDRSLVLVLPMGRTIPVSLTIPGHVPGISDLRIVSAPTNESTLEVQFAASDASADLGESPYVWFTVGCAGEPLVGVVRGKVTARDKTSGVIRAALPKPAGSRAGAGTCDVQVRVTDSGGIESNTLGTR
jgi:hypothetical protein